MKIIYKKHDLIKFLDNKKNIGFVPTMGSIHNGHLSLIRKSIKECNITIVSIFINRPQFNKKDDYINYPKKLKKDIFLLNKTKVDFVYIPSELDIYPNGHNAKIKIIAFSKILCGKYRPGHFKAIVDVVDRFIDIIKPKKIFMGEKDYQQYKIVEHFVKKKYKKVSVVCCKTIREKNGAALSSRNFLLSKKEKVIAGLIYSFLKNNKKKIFDKFFSLNFIKNKILKFGANKIDYIKMLNVNKIIKPYKKTKKNKIFIAYYLRTTRLIDNI